MSQLEKELKKIYISVDVDTQLIDVAIEKAEQLIEKLEKAKSLADDLAGSVEIRD